MISKWIFLCTSLFVCLVDLLLLVILQNGKNVKTYSLVEYNVNSFVIRSSVHSICFVLVSSLTLQLCATVHICCGVFIHSNWILTIGEIQNSVRIDTIDTFRLSFLLCTSGFVCFLLVLTPDTCLYSIQRVASSSVLNSTKAKPLEAPKRREETRAKERETQKNNTDVKIPSTNGKINNY